MIRVRRLVPLPADVVGLFLTEMWNQVLLADSILTPAPAGARSACVEVRAPLRLRTRLRLDALGGHPAPEIVAAMRMGRRTHGRVRWTLDALPAATGVELAVELESASAGVRAFLAAGGGRWLEHRLVDTVHNLAEVARLASLSGWPDSVTGEWAV